MDIALIRHPDCEGNDNRGWQSDTLELRVDGQSAGYLRMSYVPFHRLLQWHGLDAANTALAWSATMLVQDSKQFLATGQRLCVTPVLNDREIQEWLDTSGNWQLNLVDGPNLAHNIDRPVVDYIRLYRQGEEVLADPRPRFNVGARVHGEPSREDYHKRGLGMLLYAEGARWLGERGMPLYASSNQQPGALRAWQIMRQQFPGAVQDVTYARQSPWWPPMRTILDARHLPNEWVPRGTRSIQTSTAPAGLREVLNNIDELDPEQAARVREMDTRAIALGRNPRGGEPMPASPLGALRAYKKALKESKANSVPPMTSHAIQGP